MEKIFNDYKGVILFYIVIAIITLFFINYNQHKPNLVSTTTLESVKVYA